MSCALIAIQFRDDAKFLQTSNDMRHKNPRFIDAVIVGFFENLPGRLITLSGWWTYPSSADWFAATNPLTRTIFMLLPDFTHFRAGFEQFVQCSLGLDLPILHNNDVVSAPQHRAAVGNHQAGVLLSGK